ncbi:MAG TPA: metallophosphoesterase, partial [Candidatus Saccharimonadales bacterium]|nr:metallophosphoesterase [Candidatus Saccharimonadales bacterium]
PENTYAVSSLDDTGLAGTVTDSQPLNHLINHIKPFFEQEKQREEAANQAFMANIYPNIDQLIESGRIALPDEDETMYLALSDLHGNYDMIESWRYFVQQLNQRSGRSVISFVTLNGDQTYGEVTAKQAVDLEGKLADGKPVLAIMGNHDSPLTRKQMEAAGITVLGGQPVTIAGLEVLGDDDPVITKLSALFNLGDNLPRDGSQPPAEADWQRRLEVAAGQTLAETADKTDPTTVMSHEGYELAPMFGMDIDQVSAKYYDQWFAAGGDDSGSSPDDVNNLPAAAYQIGHWHKGSVKTKRYRVLNNDNGTWSTVIELGSGGGALGSMNLTHFSTPWTPPAKLASGALITINNDSGLVTRLQFPYATPDGEFSTSASRHIGSPDGQPYPSGVVAEARPKAKVTKKDGRTTVSLRGMDASGHKDGQRN